MLKFSACHFGLTGMEWLGAHVLVNVMLGIDAEDNIDGLAPFIVSHTYYIFEYIFLEIDVGLVVAVV